MGIKNGIFTKLVLLFTVSADNSLRNKNIRKKVKKNRHAEPEWITAGSIVLYRVYRLCIAKTRGCNTEQLLLRTFIQNCERFRVNRRWIKSNIWMY